MNCPRCQHEIPAALLACPGCTYERSMAALRAFQHHPLRRLHAADGSLTTARIGSVRHIQMFGAPRTFCGEGVEPGHHRGALSLEQLGDVGLQHHWVKNRVCEKCAAETTALLQEALACSA